MIKFVLINANPCILAYKQNDVFILVEVYINDFLLRSQSQNGPEWFNDWLIKEFNIKDLGKAKTITG